MHTYMKSIHFLQVVTTGYVYRWSVEYVVYAARGWLQVAGKHHNEQSVKQEALHGRIKATDAQRKSLLAHLRVLDRPGVSGITIRALIESLAYYIQMRGHFDLTSAQLTRALNDCPDLEYRVAYDAAQFVVGDEAAFDLFPMLCNASLCASDPVLAFEQLIFLDRRLESLRDDVNSGRLLSAWDALRDELGELWIGTAPQVRAANPEPSHPTCSPTVDRLIELGDIAQLLTSWFAVPQFSLIETLSGASHMPVMLRSTDDGNFPIIPGAGRSEAEVQVIASGLGISAIARRVFDEAADWSRANARTSPLSPLRWLTRGNHTALGLEVSLDELMAGDTSHVEELLRPVEGRFVEGKSFELNSGERLASIVSPTKTTQSSLSWHEMFLGRFMLVFPDPAPDVGPSSREDFLAKIAKRVPFVPAYLSQSGFAQWFGALGDPSDDDFVLIIAEAIVAIGTISKTKN